MNTWRLRCLGVLLALAQTTGERCEGAPVYDLTAFGGSGYMYAITPQGMNDSGQIVGWHTWFGFWYVDRAWRWSGQELEGLRAIRGDLFFNDAFAYGINNSGAVVGASEAGYGGSYARHATLWTPAGQPNDLGVLPGDRYSSASSINDAGQIVGSSWGTQTRAFLYDGALVDLNSWVPPNAGYSLRNGVAINNVGQIVANGVDLLGHERAFILDNTGIQDLGTLGGTSARAYGISDSGYVVGVATNGEGGWEPFIWWRQVGMRRLGTLAGSSATPYGVNNAGVVVGVNQDKRGVVWVDGLAYDLNSLIPANSGYISQAVAINNRGQIAASADARAYLLTPLAGPTTIASGFASHNPGAGFNPTGPPGSTYAPSGRLYYWDRDKMIWWPVRAPEDVDPAHPTVVLAHGWHGSMWDPTVETWARKLVELGGPECNILAWDWKDEANPSGEPTVYDDLPSLEAAQAAITNGRNQGLVLGSELMALGIEPGNLQLLGHSAGTAVMGGAASAIAAKGQKVRRLTLLDGPDVNLLFTSANALQYVDDESAQEVEVYYSDVILKFGFGAPLYDTGSPNVFNGRLYPNSAFMHSYVNDWFVRVPEAGANWALCADPPSDWSIWVGNFDEEHAETGDFQQSPVSWRGARVKSVLMREGFEAGSTWFGKNAEVLQMGVGQWVVGLFEKSDAYLFQEMTIPPNADYMTFDLAVENAGDGDYLTVSFGDQLLWYEDLAFLSEGDFQTLGALFVGDLAGETDTLLFALNSVGEANASVLLDNIEFGVTVIPEPSAMVLLGAAAMFAGLCASRKRRRRCSCNTARSPR